MKEREVRMGLTEEDVRRRDEGMGMIGLFAGLIIPPVGMIVGSLLGAFVAEFIFAKKDTFTSLKSSLGAFLGFIFGTGIKIASSGVMMYYIVTYAF